MEKNNRPDDMLSLIKIYRNIYNLYMRLTELEINNQVENNEYKQIKEDLLLCIEVSDRLLKKYSTDDEYFNNYLNLINEMNDITDDDIYWWNRHMDVPIGRLHYFSYERNLLLGQLEPKQKFEPYISIAGQNFTADEALQILEKNNVPREKIINIMGQYYLLIKEHELNHLDPSIVNRINSYGYKLTELKEYKNILEDIENYKDDKTIRNELIKLKYQALCTLPVLEDVFFTDKNIDDEIDKYENLIFLTFQDNPEPKYFEYFTQMIVKDYLLSIAHIATRNKQKYNNNEEKIEDIIVTSQLKSDYSILIDTGLTSIVDPALNEAYKKCGTDLDKEIIIKSIDVKDKDIDRKI